MLADAASPAEGKLNLLGAWVTRINASQLPVTPAQLVLLVRALPDEEADMNAAHHLRLEILNEADEPIVPATDFEYDLATVPQEHLAAGETRAAHFMLGMVGLRFPAEGVYRFSVSLDDGDPVAYPIVVVRVNQ